ncbi:hypothetical protein OC844_005007 [Tilletia horrida]|nr:hypothetical protein OC844_005007 [Tilletia horrida]
MPAHDRHSAAHAHDAELDLDAGEEERLLQLSAAEKDGAAYIDEEDEEDKARSSRLLPRQRQRQRQQWRRLSAALRALLLISLLVPTALFTWLAVQHGCSGSASTSAASTSSLQQHAPYTFSGAVASFWDWFGPNEHGHDATLLAAASTGHSNNQSVVFGLGIGDVTGPITGVGMMGYASLPQVNTGLHLRERSRAYIVGSISSTAPAPEEASALLRQAQDDEGNDIDPVDGDAARWIFVISDICMGDTAIRRAVVDQIRESYPGLYGERNFAFVGTHSHSGVGGYVNALAPSVTIGGIVTQAFDAIVNGTVRAIVNAHNDYEARRTRLLKAGATASISFGNTTLRDAHINRSKYSYSLNPAAERAMYDSDLDDEFALIRFDEDAKAQGFLSWYAVHGTSLYENNTLTSTDNKGLAAVLYETMTQPDLMPGKNTFIAGFSQASVGDTSPNTLGARCPDGSDCNNQHSTCATDKKVKMPFGPNVTVSTCLGRGPGFGDEVALAQSPTGSYDWKSNQVIAQKQVDAAASIMKKPLDKLAKVQGVVNSVKLNVDMSKFAFTLPNGTAAETCAAALGYGFAGGTTDGPGVADFQQGQNTTDPHDSLWDVIRFFFKQPSKEQMACQAPKRVLLDVGNQHLPYDWAPSIVETQILQVGNMFVIVVPGEFTTMAGRRMKEAVRKAVRGIQLLEEGQEPIVVIAGPANTYSHYITTREEYTAQRYEGGSTLFGPNTLDAYLYIYTNMLIPALKPGAGKLAPGPLATINTAKAFHPGQRKQPDTTPWGKKFGDVVIQPQSEYTIPSSSSAAASAPANVTAVFIAANPANDLRLERTYLEIQRFDADSTIWNTVRTDAHASTTMRWTAGSLGTSRMEVAWNIEPGTPAGRYRMMYWGDSKTPITGSIHEFFGVTSDFILS